MSFEHKYLKYNNKYLKYKNIISNLTGGGRGSIPPSPPTQQNEGELPPWNDDWYQGYQVNHQAENTHDIPSQHQLGNNGAGGGGGAGGAGGGGTGAVGVGLGGVPQQNLDHQTIVNLIRASLRNPPPRDDLVRACAVAPPDRNEAACHALLAGMGSDFGSGNGGVGIPPARAPRNWNEMDVEPS